MRKHVLGGQAVTDGVLMLFGSKYAIAVQEKSKIAVHQGSIKRVQSVMKIPFLRGIVALFTTLWIGILAMKLSANAQEDEDDQMGWGAIALAVLLSLALAIILFKVLPFLLADAFVSRSETVLFNLLDGALRVGIFLAYVWAIGHLGDVSRMFSYHAAEHKTINSYEATGKLTLAGARKASPLHSRCSTSFVVLVLVIAILLFALVPLTLPLGWLLLARLTLVLPIAAIGYEIIQLSARYPDSIISRILLVPGYWVQRLTTKPATDKQLKVALAAAKAALN